MLSMADEENWVCGMGFLDLLFEDDFCVVTLEVCIIAKVAFGNKQTFECDSYKTRSTGNTDQGV